MANQVEIIASAIYNDVVSGLRGFHHNISMSFEQLCQDVVDERLQILKEHSLKGILPTADLYISINCIPIDCQTIDRCICNVDLEGEEIAHFIVPQILNDYGNKSIEYIGSTDRSNPFIVYTTQSSFVNHKYRKRGKSKPYVWIDTTPNSEGYYDGFIFNAPLLSNITISAIFKDLRQLEIYNCCQELSSYNMSFVDNEIKRRLTQKKIQFYRQYSAPILPNDQQHAAG